MPRHIPGPCGHPLDATASFSMLTYNTRQPLLKLVGPRAAEATAVSGLLAGVRDLWLLPLVRLALCRPPPDGKWITYKSVPEGLLIRNAVDVSQRLELTSSPMEIKMPHWSPDGKQIAFFGGPAGKPEQIFVVPSDGGAPRQVSNGEAGRLPM